MTEWLQTGDWHLGVLSNLFEDHVDVTMKEIRKLYEYAVSHQVPYIIMGGDLSHFHFLTEQYLNALLDLALEYDDQVTTIMGLGNHDIFDTNLNSMNFLQIFCKFGLLKNLKIYEKPELMILDGMRFNLLPFPHCTPLTKKPSINVAHLEVVGGKRDNGNKVKKGEVLTTDNMWLLSHFHTHQVLTETAMYSGSLFQTNFGQEVESKGFQHCKARYKDGKLHFRYKHVLSHPNFQLVNLKVLEKSDWKKISKNQNIKYKVYVSEGITIPKNLALDHPNIISFQGYADPSLAVDAFDFSEEMREGSDAIAEFVRNPIYGLKSMLKSLGLNREQRKRGEDIVRQLQGA